ncbi:RCC1 domain-containing protein [Chitinimonas lacunae]|uniref:RCC1 domain-containing protein n=1 Tax=Chitinimonas lacunae TaxID=1963018 RepID=A0ABV8MUL2_9NEIS
MRIPCSLLWLSTALVATAPLADRLALGLDNGLVLRDNGSAVNLRPLADARGQFSLAAMADETAPPRQLRQVAIGLQARLALREDGTVWANGLSGLGATGNDAGSPSEWVQVRKLSEVVQIAAGYGHGLALKRDGTVWAWGWNVFGQIGDGSHNNAHQPLQVAGLSKVRQIGTRFNSSFALTESGELWAWGYNDHGSLGDGSTTMRLRPVKLELPALREIAIGEQHNFARTQSGEWLGWGYNLQCQVGVAPGGRCEDVLVPTRLGRSWKAIIPGSTYTLALNEDGSALWGWGRDQAGVLHGRGNAEGSITPVELDGSRWIGQTLKEVVIGRFAAAALTGTGRLYWWGQVNHIDNPAQPLPQLVQHAPAALDLKQADSCMAQAKMVGTDIRLSLPCVGFQGQDYQAELSLLPLSGQTVFRLDSLMPR